MKGDYLMIKDNTVFVGNKPVMNYVLAVVTQFNNGAQEVAIKARGKAISRAVDTAEIALNRFLEGVDKKEIITSTEVIDTDSGKTNVSSIEIILANQVQPDLP
jgi:archaea-specific DNA-binding protein